MARHHISIPDDLKRRAEKFLGPYGSMSKLITRGLELALDEAEAKLSKQLTPPAPVAAAPKPQAKPPLPYVAPPAFRRTRQLDIRITTHEGQTYVHLQDVAKHLDVDDDYIREEVGESVSMNGMDWISVDQANAARTLSADTTSADELGDWLKTA